MKLNSKISLAKHAQKAPEFRRCFRRRWWRRRWKRWRRRRRWRRRSL